MKEQWKDIEGYEGQYQVSTHGRVRSLDRNITYSDGRVARFKGKMLTPTVASHGYPIVSIKSEKRCVHRLVLETFAPRPDWAECANHKDGVKTNNHLDNLEWSTYSQNTIHARETGLNKQYGENCNLTTIPGEDVREIRRLGRETDLSQREIAERFDVSRPTVSEILSGKSRKYG